MLPYKRLMVGLSMKDEDPNTLEYAAMFHRLSQSEKVYFIHVPPSLDLPEEVKKEFPELWEPADESIAHTMQMMVDEHYRVEKSSEVACEVAEGSPIDELLHKIHYKDVDLVIIGEHLGRDHTHNLSAKLARKGPCSLLVVPENSHARIERILVGIDFSEHSIDALQTAISIAEAAGLEQVLCVHSYQVPIGYEKTGKSHDEFADIMCKNAKTSFEQFSKKISTQGVSLVPIFRLDHSPEHAISEEAADKNADLVVLGSRGRSPGASILLGSVTEAVLKKIKAPVLAVKQKGKTLNLLGALLQL